MTFEDFDIFFDDFVAECRRMRDTKGREYAHSMDRFDNFNRLAERLHLPRVKIAQVYLTKHLDSIEGAVDSAKVYSEDDIRGRFIDAVVYLILMAGMIDESGFDAPV